MDFLETHKSNLNLSGFWREESEQSVIYAIESKYKTEILMKYFISDIVLSNKILVKWDERHKHLTEEQVNELYGRK